MLGMHVTHRASAIRDISFRTVRLEASTSYLVAQTLKETPVEAQE